jgi:hypothetical protein
MGLKKYHAVLISSNDFWVYDPDSYDSKTKLYGDFTVVKGDSKKEDSDMKRCSYFFEVGNADNHGFKPTSIKYDDAEGFLVIEGEQAPMNKVKRRVFQIGEDARRYKNMRGPRHSVNVIVVSRDSKKQEIKDYLKQQQEDSKGAESFSADTLNQINPIFVEGAEDIMGAESEIFCADCGGRRKYDAESFEAEHSCGCGDEMALEAEEWDFGNDREALRNSDENSDFNNAWRMVFKTKRREWPSWGQKFYDKYKWTLDDSTWNPYAKGGVFEDEEEPKGFRDAEGVEGEILDMVEQEGGALGMQNLTGIADENVIQETISDMKEDGILFEHKHGDYYTHEPVEAETFEAQSDDLFVLTFSDPMRYGKMVQLPFTSRNQAERYVDMHIRPYNKKRPHQNIVYSIKQDEQDEQDEQDVVDFVQEISPFPMGKLFASFIVVGVSAIAGAKLLNR